jgi:hypothetical protein
MDLLSLAVQCKARGWDALARKAYDRFRADQAEWEASIANDPRYRLWREQRTPEERATSASAALRRTAWRHWEGQVTAGGSDRKLVLARLRATAQGDPPFSSLAYTSFLKDLELTVAARTSKPGSVEALIDDLMEYRPRFSEEVDPEAAFWALAEWGFDAVPALIAHAQDRRFTRETTAMFNNFRPYHVRVGHLASRLLDDLSGGELGVWGLRGDVADLDAARAWWEIARLFGEERWLVEHALPGTDPEGEASFSYSPNVVIFRALGSKYPARLGEVYRTVLRKRPKLESEALARVLAASQIPRERKVALLEEGAGHATFAHRLAALKGLSDVDSAALRKPLIRVLDTLHNDIDSHHYWAAPEEDLVYLVQRADDPACWDALARTARRVAVGLRFQFIANVTYYRQFGLLANAGPEGRCRRESIRFLVGFLNDGATRGDVRSAKQLDSLSAAEGSTTLEVRDFAANQLSFILSAPYTVDPDDGALHRFITRCALARLATLELAMK